MTTRDKAMAVLNSVKWTKKPTVILAFVKGGK